MKPKCYTPRQSNTDLKKKHTHTYKDSSAKVNTSSTTSKESTAPNILQCIDALSSDNTLLIKKKIKSTKNKAFQHAREKVTHLKKKSATKRFIARRIFKINHRLSTFNDLAHNRATLTKNGISFKPKQDETNQRKTALIQERYKSNHCHKILNFTDTTLPSNLTDTLNKGTNFIPTSSKLNPAQLKTSTTNEVTTTLNSLILKPTY